ncbi:MAG: hypothetical protein MH204_02450, partial [Fimbriimonadaceae bacterium]|nr:hypothetical protein [Fimbriimonadaceae bacterium]
MRSGRSAFRGSGAEAGLAEAFLEADSDTRSRWEACMGPIQKGRLGLAVLMEDAEAGLRLLLEGAAAARSSAAGWNSVWQGAWALKPWLGPEWPAVLKPLMRRIPFGVAGTALVRVGSVHADDVWEMDLVIEAAARCKVRDIDPL